MFDLVLNTALACSKLFALFLFLLSNMKDENEIMSFMEKSLKLSEKVKTEFVKRRPHVNVTFDVWIKKL